VQRRFGGLGALAFALSLGTVAAVLWLETTARVVLALLSAMTAYTAHARRVKDADNELIARRRLERMACQDALTGLHNRASLDVCLRETIDACSALGRQAVGILIDLDHFKQVNDRLGHDAGDELLVRVAETLKKQLRPCDQAFRYGGDELLVVLADIDLHSAEAVARRIAWALQLAFVDLRAQGIAVGSSMGLSPVAVSDTPQTLITRMDEALYRAKRSGRGRLELAVYAQ
jgi:diguanylate cyclase (GGDEF)-like protein